MIRGVAAYVLSACVFVCASSAQTSDAPAPMTVEERLAALEAQVRELRNENEQLRKELGLEGKAGQVVVKPAGRAPTMQVGGLIQVQTEAGDKGDSRFSDDNDRFFLRRARVNMSGKFLEEFDFRIESELGGSLSNSSAMRAAMTDAFVNWNRYPKANIRIGQFKTGYGFEQIYSDPRLYVPERSLANDRLTLSRQIGLQAQGEFLDKRLSYAAGAFNGNGLNNSFNDDERFLKLVRLGYVPFDRAGGTRRLAFGTNAYWSEDANVAMGSDFGFDANLTTAGRDNIFTGERSGWGADSQLTAGPFELWIEYLAGELEPRNSFPARSIDAEGGYVQASYFVIPKLLQAVAKWEGFDPNDRNRGDDTATSWLGANYYLKGHDIKFQLFYLRVDAPDLDEQDKVIARVQTIF